MVRLNNLLEGIMKIKELFYLWSWFTTVKGYYFVYQNQEREKVDGQVKGKSGHTCRCASQLGHMEIPLVVPTRVSQYLWVWPTRKVHWDSMSRVFTTDQWFRLVVPMWLTLLLRLPAQQRSSWHRMAQLKTLLPGRIFQGLSGYLPGASQGSVFLKTGLFSLKGGGFEQLGPLLPTLKCLVCSFIACGLCISLPKRRFPESRKTLSVYSNAHTWKWAQCQTLIAIWWMNQWMSKWNTWVSIYNKFLSPPLPRRILLCLYTLRA